VRTALILVAAVFGAMQVVPYRVSNPADRHEPPWDSAATRRLVVAACYDCHSNQAHVYPWERVAPLSWWITNHVDDGRKGINFSQWDLRPGPMGDAIETVKDKTMPPSYYTWFGLHGDAKLTAAQRQELAGGLRTTLAGWNCGDGG